MKEQQKAEAYVREKLPELMVECNVCRGHGKEICDNPDHGLIDALCGVKSSDIGRLGCPVCGHDEYRRTKYDCNVCKGTGKVISHPIQLQHWLRVLREACEAKHFAFMMHDDGTIYDGDDDFDDTGFMSFDLTTGQPATEADYKAFNEIVGI